MQFQEVSAPGPAHVARLPDAERRQIGVLGLLGALLIAGALGVGVGDADHLGKLGFGLLGVGGTLLALGVGLGGLCWRRARRRAVALTVLAPVLDAAREPLVLTDPADGQVLWHNSAAVGWVGLSPGMPMAAALANWRAAPDATVQRLLDRVDATGSARLPLPEGVGGQVLELTRAAGPMVLWRLSDSPDAAGSADGSAVARLRLDRDGHPVAINRAYRLRFGSRLPASSLAGPGADGDAFPRVCADLGLTELRLDLPGGERELCFLPTQSLTQLAQPQATAPDFDTLPVGLIRIDPDGAIGRINDEARRLLGLQPDEAAAVADVLEGPGRPASDWLAEAQTGRGLNRTEVLRATRAPVSDFLQVTLRQVSAADRAAMFAVLSDATDFKELEEKFTQSQKMHAVGQLAGGVAHDFNNLLTAISGYCDLLLLRRDPTDGDYADLIQIQQNTNRAASLVRQLLAFSRKQRMEPELLDVGDTLRDLTHLLNRLLGERVTLTLAHGDAVGCIRADRRQFEQVLINLVVNARDAMPLGGEIRVETQALHLSAETRRDHARIPPGDYTLITVRDEGVGIPADKLQKVFEPFFTTKRQGEGTGLGLSTAYGIVKQSGGFIFADSIPGAGTTFTLYFLTQAPGAPVHPRAAKDIATRVRDEPAVPAPARVGCILLVEDEAPVRAFTARALEMRGHTVLQADCGEAALEILADPSRAIDLFVSDVLMPGLDGPAWVARARETRPELGGIFVSGHAEDHLPLSGMNFANAVFLPKPYSLQQMTDLVFERLG